MFSSCNLWFSDDDEGDLATLHVCKCFQLIEEGYEDRPPDSCPKNWADVRKAYNNQRRLYESEDKKRGQTLQSSTKRYTGSERVRESLKPGQRNRWRMAKRDTKE